MILSTAWLLVRQGSTCRHSKHLRKVYSRPTHWVPDYYPPALTGMRGSVDGTYEIAHALAREGRAFSLPKEQTETTYDLIVVGGGISGLAAAKFFRDRHGSDSKILVLDNHDDFGGHARRNELSVDGDTLIGYGGSQAIDTPSAYSPVASQLLRDLGIFVERFYDYHDQSFFEDRGMTRGIYFDEATFGKRAITENPIQDWWDRWGFQLSNITGDMPIPKEDQQAFASLLKGGKDYLKGLSNPEREAVLRETSYLDFLKDYAATTGVCQTHSAGLLASHDGRRLGSHFGLGSNDLLVPGYGRSGGATTGGKRGALHLQISGRQRQHCACPGPKPDSGRYARQHHGRSGHSKS